MNCNEFRSAFAPASSDAAVLEHVRSCDPCLDFAAHVDPDIMFRALGGAEMIPPGGIDLFVEDVMRAVHLRKAEGDLAPHRATVSWTRRLAIAATLVTGVFGGTLVYRYEQTPAPTQPLVVHHSFSTAPKMALATKPLVESYSSSNATIVEMPAESANDAQVVMILDENLPADL